MIWRKSWRYCVAKGFNVKKQKGFTYLQLPLFRRTKHAFCTRAGEKAVLEALGVPEGRLLTLRQVHGAEVLVYEGDTRMLTHPLPYDAVITDKKRVALAISTADCLPILMIDRSKKVIAAIHAGWRGMWRGVVRKTVSTMIEAFESSPGDILAGIGPAIGPCCYEVGTEVVSLFQNSSDSPQEFIQEREGKTYLDLSRAAQLELNQVGIPLKNIETISLCTACRKDLFYSYRRDGKTGRQLSFIML
jgi:YfiH family protein